MVEGGPAHGRDATLMVWSHNLGTVSRQRDCRRVPLKGGLKQLLNADCLCEVAGEKVGLLAVGAGGAVCYWPDIWHDTAPQIAPAGFDKADDHPIALASCEPLGYILATKYGLLFQVNVRALSGRPSLSFQRIVGTASLLGWGMSMIFGGAAEPTVASCNRIAVQDCPGSGQRKELYVLTGTGVQRWSLNTGEPHSLETTHDFLNPQDTRAVIDADLQQCMQDQRVAGDVELVDMVCHENEVYALLLANQAVIIGTSGRDIGTWRWAVSSQAGRGDERNQWKLGATVTGCTIAIDCAGGVLHMPREDGSAWDTVRLDTQNIYGVAAVSENDVLVVTDRQGGSLLKICGKYANDAVPPTPVAQAGAAASKVDVVDDVLTAFEKDLHLSNQSDASTVEASQKIVDRPPISDPRWAEKLEHRQKDMSSSSLIIVKLLDHKKTRHDEFLKYLNQQPEGGAADTDTMWNGLAAASQCEILKHGELLTAAIALRKFQGQSAGREAGKLVSDAILETLRARNEHSVNANDVFYRDVSKLWELVPVLEKMGRNLVDRFVDEAKRTEIVVAVNEILKAMIELSSEAYPRRNSELYAGRTGCWTSIEVKVQDALIRQHTSTVEHAFRDATLSAKPEAEKRGYQRKLHMLSKCILEGFQNRLAVERGNEVLGDRYRGIRTELLAPFLEEEALSNLAYDLAERHEDFTTLMILCERSNDNGRLARYAKRYGTSFTEFKYKWYLDNDLRHKVLVTRTDDSNLTEFLRLGGHESLAWVRFFF